MRSFALFMFLLCPILASGCEEPRGPLLAGGREVKSWVGELKSPKAKIRRKAVLKLGNVGDDDPAVAPALLRALDDADPLVRHDALLAVVKLKSPGEEIVARLQTMARSDKDPRARESAGKALKNLGREE